MKNSFNLQFLTEETYNKKHTLNSINDLNNKCIKDLIQANSREWVSPFSILICITDKYSF